MSATEEGAYITLSERRRERLEQYFQRRTGYSKKQLVKMLAADLADVREAHDFSLRTLNYDIKYLVKKGAELDKIKRKTVNSKGKTITEYGYRYVNPKWTYKKNEVDSDTLTSIKVAASILSQIPGIQIHQDLKEIYDNLANYADTRPDQRAYIVFDYKEGVSGVKHIPKILQAIYECGVISFKYQPFGAEKPFVDYVSPYLLKEHESRWYLIGYSSTRNDIRHYGLDRIVSKDVTVDLNRSFMEAAEFDPASYFQHVIGITMSKDAKPVDIIFKVDKPRALHVDHSPLHSSQAWISQDEKSKTYLIKLIHNYELENLLLSLGKDIEVIQPESLRSRMCFLLKEAIAKYS